MRCLLWAILGVLVGCADIPRRPVESPAALVVVFADGFHSGLILDRGEVPSRLLPAGSREDWVVVHYGERRWILGEADGCIDAVRLAMLGGEGGVQIDAVPWWRHDRGGTDLAHERIWVFPVSRRDLDRLRSRLDGWIAGSGGGQIGPETCWWPSSRSWTLGRNCHDFTADLLAAAGIALERDPIEVASGMRAALDRAWSERERS